MFSILEIKSRYDLTWEDLPYIEAPAFAHHHALKAIQGRDPYAPPVQNIEDFRRTEVPHYDPFFNHDYVENHLRRLFFEGQYFSISRPKIPLAPIFNWRPIAEHPDGGEWIADPTNYSEYFTQKLEEYAKYLGAQRRRKIAEQEEAEATPAALVAGVKRVAEKVSMEKPKSTLSERRGVSPRSLDDASMRLKSMKDEIAIHGHIPKYTDKELLLQAKAGEVAKERYHVRFMEVSHQWDRGDVVRDENNLTGKLGGEFTGETGTGPRYWSTTFDQIEDADTDAELICLKLGINYHPKTSYMLTIIDTEKSVPLTGCECVAATFNNISEFTNRELPQKFPKEFTDEVMNAEYQSDYKAHYLAARTNFLDSDWSTNTNDFSDYLSTTDLSDKERKTLIKRMEMQKQVGCNQHYLGNGLTENKINNSTNLYGVVETHNFERTPTDLQKLKANNVVKIIYL